MRLCNKMKNSSSQINPGQVRLLLFKECDRRGRKLLFDSSTIEKVPSNKNDKPSNKQTSERCILEVSEGFSYIYKGAAADANLLGEMIFGAVAMNYKNVSLKIHIMDEPRRLMCTKVFCVPTARRVSRVERKQEEKSSMTNGCSGSKSLNVPLVTEEGVSMSFSIERGDSGFYGEHSPYSSVGSTYDYVSKFDVWDGSNTQEDLYTFKSPSGRKLSTSSNGSWQRRTFQNLATRFDLGNNHLLNLPQTTSNVTSTDSQVYSNSSTSDSLTSTGSSMTQRRSKLGLALLFTVTNGADIDLVRRCVENSPQLQALVGRVRLATLAAGAGSGFISTLHRAACDAGKWLSDLMYGPRLQPMWLTLVSRDAQIRNNMAENLLSDLCSVLAVGDTKDTNFFISTLLTHVLTYHLGWVPTVSPYDTVDSQKLPSESTNRQKPYNALWAQLSDLCGSIGCPPRAARTIISGTTNPDFIQRLLVVLTYFLRCGDVARTDFEFQDRVPKETKVVNVQEVSENASKNSLNVPTVNTQSSNSSVCTVVTSEDFKRSTTLANISQQLSSSSDVTENGCTSTKPSGLALRRNPTTIMPLRASSDTSLSSSGPEEVVEEKSVLFVLGENEKLVGLKNKKSNDGKSVKKSSKVHIEPIKLDEPKEEVSTKEKHERNSVSPSKCCSQILQHSKPIKHSGFKFEFDKYPQIVTNYMKSKNLEILDRHYIGKPGNLKMDNFQFDPTIVPDLNSFQEERCETCYKCQLIESTLQTPTNASEMEYMNDIPRPSEPQYAKQSVVKEESHGEVSPKNFVRKRQENTVVINPSKSCSVSVAVSREMRRTMIQEKKNREFKVNRVIEFPMPEMCPLKKPEKTSAGFCGSMLGGVTDHYVPDLVLQGTITKSNAWESELRRDLELTSYLNKIHETPLQSIAIIGNTSTWEVRVSGGGGVCGGGVGGGGGGGLSPLVGAALDALPAMRRARVPALQCLTFLEGKLREFCVLSKSLADMLLCRDFCDIGTLTRSLNIDVNDVPLLLAVATTHTPQVAARYGISYR
ncbi:folliculin-interacting protein 2 isoform X2 [Plodia interpunctella]|uniref:folliculin-interacting protein 2 isoform X2 n=1 Tax=Plodia interpunctella TaxID=58824 RepID=UPI002368995C|nr:folliculin-interacting protein 2 isoform X2 [Plodia interpunctella]